jgi:hypothetical protein
MTDDPKPVIIKLHPSPEEYLEAETDFLRSVGACVTRWAFVDRQLFRLYRLGLGAPTHTAAAIYFDQNTIGQRLRQVNNLLTACLSEKRYEQHKEPWVMLHKRVDALLPVRNAIAHSPVKRTGTARDGKAVYVYAIYLEPYRRHLPKKPKVQELHTEDLKQHAIEVEALESDLKAFAHELIVAGQKAHKTPSAGP